MVNETNENVTLENMVETETELANPPTNMAFANSGVSTLADPDPEDVFEAYISTYEIGRGIDMTSKLEYSLRDIESAISTLQTDKADTAHTHDGYVSQSDLETLSDVVDAKADATHTHAEYASSVHTHDDYITATAFDSLTDTVNGKADASHTHTEYSPISHTHTEYADASHVHDNYASISHSHSDYAEVTHEHDNYALSTHTHTASEIGAASSEHNHDSDYANISHNHDGAYATVGHDHNEDYATIDHVHSDYATITSLNDLSAIVSNKANVSHSHDDAYYTETEIDTKLASKADSSHTHTNVYDAIGSAASALTSANAYTDSKIDALVGDGASTTLDTIGEISSAIEDNQDAIDLLNSAIANKANVVDLNSHASDMELHITEAERIAWNAKSDFSGSYNDLTNKPTIPSIDGLATEIYVDTQIDAIVIPDALSDLTTDSTHRVVTDAEKAAWNAKSNFSGSYSDLTDKPSIPSISGLATEIYVDEAVSAKADNGHTHGDIYYTESEVDSLLSAKANSNHNHDSIYDALGTAETKANEVQANLDVVSENLVEHIDNADVHFTVAERTKLSGIATNANNYTHPNSGVTAGTYKSVTVNAQGHITAGTNPTTLAGYGITDAESKGAANSALTSAKEYTNDAIADEVIARDSAIATAKSSAISTAASDATTKANSALASAKTYADSVGAAIKDELLNGAGEAYNTLKELGDLIDDNTDAIEALESVASGKANAVHTHAVSDVTGLQAALDGKAASSHGTHVTYSTTAPVMNGTASVGTASTVARSDHKHPIDTSRASKTEFDTHASDTTKHITSTERTNWGTAYTHSQVAHAPSDAQKNQNAFSYVKVGETSVAADTTTDTITLVAGTNVTITPDATNDKITISATDTNTTYSAGTGISLSGTTFSNSGVRSIATGSANGTISVNTNGTSANVAVKGLGSAAYTASTAYDAAGTAQTKADAALVSAKAYADEIKNDLLNGASTAYDTLKELGDLIDVNVDAIDALETVAASKANASDLTSHTSNKSNPHGVTLAQLGVTATASELNKLDGVTATTAELNIMDGVTATTAEINYLDGVTSNIQAQLDGKSSTSHSHSVATTSAAGLMSASDKAKLNGIASGANAYTLPTASSTLGGVKTTSTVTSASGYTACPIISGVPYYKDTNTTYNLGSFGITATAAELNALDGITATVTELNYVDGVTSNIQTQLNAKASSSHTHNYAGSSSAGGAATSANKLNTNAGSATQPVYFANGIPVKTTYTLGASVPSGAKFTDTTYSAVTTSANGLMIASDKSKLDGMVLATVSEVETYLGI